RRRHTRFSRDWSSDVCSSDLVFAYYPFPGTFMPTNGSSDDVLIRLPEAFRQIKAGIYDQETYRINLAIVESMIKEQDIPISMVRSEERRVGKECRCGWAGEGT